MSAREITPRYKVTELYYLAGVDNPFVDVRAATVAHYDRGGRGDVPLTKETITTTSVMETVHTNLNLELMVVADEITRSFDLPSKKASRKARRQIYRVLDDHPGEVRLIAYVQDRHQETVGQEGVLYSKRVSNPYNLVFLTDPVYLPLLVLKFDNVSVISSHQLPWENSDDCAETSQPDGI